MGISALKTDVNYV